MFFKSLLYSSRPQSACVMPVRGWRFIISTDMITAKMDNPIFAILKSFHLSLCCSEVNSWFTKSRFCQRICSGLATSFIRTGICLRTNTLLFSLVSSKSNGFSRIPSFCFILWTNGRWLSSICIASKHLSLCALSSKTMKQELILCWWKPLP